METSEIKKMSASERLRAMETLWNSLLSENEDIEAPEWHGKIIAERKKKMDKEEAKFISIKDLKK